MALEPPKSGPPPVIGVIVWGGIGLWLLTHSDIHGAALTAGFAIGIAASIISGRKGVTAS